MQAENIEKRILDLLSEELLSTSEVAKRINMRRDAVSGYLEALRNQGKLEKIRVGRSNVYRTVALKTEFTSTNITKGRVAEKSY